MTRLADGVYRRGRRLWIRYTVRGHEYREPVDTQSVQQATRLRIDRIAAVRRGERLPSGDRLTIAQVLDLVVADYRANARRSWPAVQGQVDAVRRALGRYRAIDLTPELVQRTQAAWLLDGVSAATCNRRLNFLRRGCTLALRARLLAVVPYVPRLKEPARRAQYHRGADAARILAALPAYVRPLLRFAYATGIRRGQLAHTRRQWVDLERGIIMWPATVVKADQPHVLPLDQETRAIVREALSQRRPWCPYLFHGPRCRPGRAPSQRYGCVGDFKRAWAAAMRACGLPVGRAAGGYTFHGARHTFATDWIAAGGSVSDAQAIGSWKTASMVSHYNLGDVEALRRRLDAQRAPRATVRRLRG